MAENLKVTHYNDGDEISYPSDEDFGSDDEGQYGVYDNDPANADIYGNLYNFAVTVDDRGVCPDGWHVPSDDEYTILTTYLGGISVAGGKMKETGFEHWISPNTGATNESGFTGLPAGYRSYSNGSYLIMGTNGYFWSSSEYDSELAWYRVLVHSSPFVHRNAEPKQFGFSIRCLAEEITTGCTDPEACNYNEAATVNDGSCEYAEENYDCDGNCLVEVDCAGNCCVLGEEGCYWQETGPCGEEGPSDGMDSCGVCGGDNTSCMDCSGVPCSDAYMDNCGVCDDIPENDCVQDCAGTWGGDAIIDECDVCGGDNTSCQQLGDINGDGYLDVLDVVLMVNMILEDEYDAIADMNEDGVLNVLDVVILVNLILDDEPSLCDGLTEVELWGETYDIATTDSLLLYAQELTGSIPPEIGCLTNLTYLWLGVNQLTGEIPSTIGNLTNLSSLILSYNQLTGEIPPEIGNLTNLTHLVLNNNQLTGDIPQAVCDLIESNNLNMDYILDGNNLTNTCD